MLSSRLLLRFSRNSQLHSPISKPILSQFQNRRQFSITLSRMSTITGVVTHDHVELDEYYQNILNAKDNDTKTRWQNQLAWELARHSIAEELVVYPAMEKYIPNGKAMADEDRQEHAKVRDAYSCGRIEISLTYICLVGQGAPLQVSRPQGYRCRLRAYPQDLDERAAGTYQRGRER